MKDKVLLLVVFAALVAPVYAGSDSVLYTADIVTCNIVATYSGAKGEKGTMVIRARPLPNKKPCRISKSLLTSTLNEAFKALESKKDLAELSSIFLANKLRAHRWMSDFLIKKSKNDIHWNAKIGKPKKGSSNKYVNKLLFSGSVLTSLIGVLKRYHYRITSVSCEKIIVNKNKLPFDAMCWIKVKRELAVRERAR